jgi:putative transposase
VQGLLLDAAADLVDGGQAELGDMEGVRHPHRARQLGAQRRRIASERVERGDLDTVPPVPATGRDPVRQGLSASAFDHVEQPSRPVGTPAQMASQIHDAGHELGVMPAGSGQERGLINADRGHFCEPSGIVHKGLAVIPNRPHDRVPAHPVLDCYRRHIVAVLAVDQLVLSLTARGLTTGEIAAHFAEVYGATVSKDTISRITDRVVEEMLEWCKRPLDRVYPVIFIDAIVVKIRDGQVVNRPIYVVIGVTVNGERDILGLWVGDGSEGAKFWLSVLTEIKNRGVEDVCIAVCDGLKGLPDSISTAWPLAVVQACILHLFRNTFRYASRKDWEAISKELRPVYTAPTEAAAAARFAEFTETWGGRYPAIVRLWQSAWDEFIPFLDYDVEIRRVLSSTNAIESINARYRRAVRARGHFPTEQAALKCLYLVTRSLDPTGRGKARWAMRWKPALNAFAITFAGRIVPSALN